MWLNSQISSMKPNIIFLVCELTFAAGEQMLVIKDEQILHLLLQ
jgi:hypothetical protein